MYVLMAGQKFSYNEIIIGVTANKSRAEARLAELQAQGWTVTDEDGDRTTFDHFWISEAPTF